MHVLENPTELAPIGGVELSMLQVAQQLVARGHSLSALYVRPGSNLPAWQALSRAMRQVPSFDCTQAHFLRDLTRLPTAVGAARAMAPDVVYLNRAEQMVFGLLAARASSAPLVVHLRTHLHFPGVKVAGTLAAHFIAVSDFVRDHWIAAGVPAHKITTVHNGIDPAVYAAGGLVERTAARASLGLPDDVYTVLYYGRVSDGKGVGTLLEAWRRLGLSPDEARLVIVGGSPDDRMDSYERALRESSPAGCLWLPLTDDVIPALHAADTVVLPAEWQEPFGRVVIEGLSSGRPVIGTRVGGIPEILTGEFADLLVDPGDVAGLAAKIGSLRHWRRSDPGLAGRCTAHVVDHFTLAKTVDGVEQVLLAATGTATATTGTADGVREIAAAPDTTPIDSRRPSRRSLQAVDTAPAITPAETVDPGLESLRAWVLQDKAANAGRPDSQAVLALFRLGQWAHRHWGRPGRLLSLGCMIVSSIGFSVELPSRIEVGPRLQLFHPHSIVLNPGVRLGADCMLRHNTTLGNIVDRDGTERGNPTIGDGVDLGAGCAVLGPVVVGDHARVGALAVVTKDVPAWAVVVGNPARVLRIDASSGAGGPLERRAVGSHLPVPSSE